MHKYAAHFSYDGTLFCGWQKQKGSAAIKAGSVQETIEDTIREITQEKVSCVGSGRTDAGVHAAGQIAHFILKNREWSTEILKRGLNSKLPLSIRCCEVRPMPIDFHAQRSATHKQYSYYFLLGPSEIPHLLRFTRWSQKHLDAEAMQEAARILVGEHDFKPFQASGSKPGPTVRKILESEILLEKIVFPGSANFADSRWRLLRYRVVGTGFLKQMVRGIAGTLLQVGLGQRKPEIMREILQSLDRKRVGPTAPARGLWLEKVWYPQWKEIEN